MGIADALNQGLNDLTDLLNGVLGGSSGNGPQPDAQPNDDPNANNTPTPPEGGPPLEDWGDGGVSDNVGMQTGTPPVDGPSDPAMDQPLPGNPYTDPVAPGTGNAIGQGALDAAGAGEAATNTLGGQLGQSAFGTPTSSDSQVGDASQAASAQAGLAPPDSSTPWGQNLGTIGVPGVGAFGDGLGIGGFAPSGAQLAANAVQDAPFATGIPGAGGVPGSMSAGGETPYGISGIASSAEAALGWQGSSPAGEAIDTLNGIPADVSDNVGMQTGNADPASFASEPTQAERDAGLDALRQYMQPSSNTLSPSDLAIGGAAAAGAAALLGGSSAAAPAAAAPTAATADNTGQSDTGLGFTNPVAPSSSASDLAAQAAAQVQQNMDAAKAADAQIPNTANTQIPGSDAILQPGQFAGVPTDPITQPVDMSGVDAINKAAGINPETGNQYPTPSVPPSPPPSDAELLGMMQNEPTQAQRDAGLDVLRQYMQPSPNTQIPNVGNTQIPGSSNILPSGLGPPPAGGYPINGPSQIPNVGNTQIPGSSNILPSGMNPPPAGGYPINDPTSVADDLAAQASAAAQRALEASRAIEQATSPSATPDTSSAKQDEPAPTPKSPDPITRPSSTRPVSSSSSSSSRSGSLGSNTRSFSAGSNLNNFNFNSGYFQQNGRSISELGSG